MDSTYLFLFTISVEIVFAIDIIFNFLTEFWGDDFFYPVRDLKKIATRYLKSIFIVDLLAVIPFQFFFVKDWTGRDDNDYL